jgi:hypothetical protein
MFGRPGLDVGVVVGAVVVEDHVDLEGLGDLPVDATEELYELGVAVPGYTAADDDPGEHVERRE